MLEFFGGKTLQVDYFKKYLRSCHVILPAIRIDITKKEQIYNSLKNNILKLVPRGGIYAFLKTEWTYNVTIVFGIVYNKQQRNNLAWMLLVYLTYIT